MTINTILPPVQVADITIVFILLTTRLHVAMQATFDYAACVHDKCMTGEM